MFCFCFYSAQFRSCQQHPVRTCPTNHLLRYIEKPETLTNQKVEYTKFEFKPSNHLKKYIELK